MKPDVVFFGETVSRNQDNRGVESLEEANAMLVVGSSLMVYSGFRFIQAAARISIPIAAVNLGRTRADDLLALKVEGRCEGALFPPVACFLCSLSGRALPPKAQPRLKL
jgi:NAD-dependent SIR2 family protein deacetylase